MCVGIDTIEKMVKKTDQIGFVRHYVKLEDA